MSLQYENFFCDMTGNRNVCVIDGNDNGAGQSCLRNGDGHTRHHAEILQALNFLLRNSTPFDERAALTLSYFGESDS